MQLFEALVFIVGRYSPGSTDQDVLVAPGDVCGREGLHGAHQAHAVAVRLLHHRQLLLVHEVGRELNLKTVNIM